MSNSLKSLKILGLLLCSTLFSACTDRVAGIEGTGQEEDGLIADGDTNVDIIAARGSVTKFGSIYVNGIHFNTDHSEFMINGKAVDEQAIQQGMVVYIKGKPGATDTEAEAERVTLDYLAQGSIENIVNSNSNQRTITVLGYTIIANEESMAEESDNNESAFDNLKVGDYISVSGFTDGAKTITATRIILEDATITDKDTVSLSGHISSHSSTEMTFSINEQIIDYSDAVFSSDDVSSIIEGKSVRVEGKIQHDIPSSETSTIKASKIDFKKEEPISKSRNFSTEGIIADFTSTADFMLNGIQVDASTAISENKISGDTNTPIGNGRRITIKGSQNDAGVLIANSLHVHHVSATRISGPVSSIQAESGTFTVSGIEFQTNDYTKFEDLGNERNRYFDLEDIRLEDKLDIFSLTHGEKHIAVTVRRKKPQGLGHTFSARELRIKGVVSSLNKEDKQFYLMDIFVDANNIDDLLFEELTPNTPIFVTGQFDSGDFNNKGPSGGQLGATKFRNKVFIAEEIFILRSNCTSHRKVECDNQRSITDRPKGGGPFLPKDREDKKPQFEANTSLPTNTEKGRHSPHSP